MNKKIYLIFSLCLMIFLVACSKDTSKVSQNNDEKLKIITTIFPTYDFIREIAGENVNVRMLLKPGEESHSYEPTPKDIISIQNSDLFIYVGGENDFWVEDILNSMGKDKPQTLKLLETVPVLTEEIVEGMQDSHNHDDHSNDHDHSHEEKILDEHVWTSPINAILIVEKITEILSEKDLKNSEIYALNSKEYIEKLELLDKNFRELISNSERNLILFGDRFPFRYLANEYGLNYYAAFSGCSTETEASPKTVAFLIDKVKEQNLPIVFTMEFSNGKIADSIVDATKSKKMLLNSGHNLTKDEFEKGVTYLSLMQQNIEVLREALN